MTRVFYPLRIHKIFWAKVNKNGPIISYVGTSCWEWQGARNKRGYGRLQFTVKRVRSPYLAHRVAWMLCRSEIPQKLFVCHKCDNPACVRPSHLFLGTALDNNLDKNRKGRQPTPSTNPLFPRGPNHHWALYPEKILRGEQSTSSVLRKEQVLEARRLYVLWEGKGIKLLASQYGVTYTAVRKAIIGESWAHLPGAVPSFRTRRTKSLVAEMDAMYAAGVSRRKVAAHFGVKYYIPSPLSREAANRQRSASLSKRRPL